MRYLLAGVLVFALVTLGIYWVARNFAHSRAAGGDFTLSSAEGPVSLHQFRGKVVIIYFGYTSCPDACPFSLGRLSKVLKEIPEAKRNDFVPIFISVDPKRDTPDKVSHYASFFFHGVSYGLTGTPEQLDSVLSQYGTSYVVDEQKDSALGYTVQHSTNFYLVNRSGQFVSELPTETAPDALKAALLALL